MIQLLNIVGQAKAIVQLEQSMHSARMPHAFLFAGPAGVGRKTTARALAATLLCHQPVKVQPTGEIATALAAAGGSAEHPFVQACGRCDDCRMMEALSHPDYQPVYKELAAFHEDSNVRGRVMQELGIDVIRSFLIAPVARSSTRGRGKVFVVHEAELMSPAAQNSLLKTLEEPPPGVTIILVAERPEEMLATTLSRCAVVRFGPLPRPFVTGKLVESGVAAAEADFWAAFTGGSIGRATRLARQGMYAVKRDLVEQLAALTPAGDADLGDRLNKTAEALADAAIKETKDTSGGELSKTLAGRQAAAMMLDIIASAFGDAMHLACGGEAAAMVNADQPDVPVAIGRRLDGTRLAQVLQQLSEFEGLLWRNANAKIIWDNVVITCASAAPLQV